MAIQRKTVVVTGGASGIGKAICDYFASLNYRVAIFDFNESEGKKVAAQLAQDYVDATVVFHRCNVALWEDQKQAFEKVYNEFGSIDIVIANAGISERGRLIMKEDKPTRPDLSTLDTNLSGTIYSVKLGIHYIGRNPVRSDGLRGTVVCTASNAGIYPFPVAPIYAASKHAVVGLVRSMARPLLPENININGLAPAVLATNIAPDSSLFNTMILTPMSTLIRAVAQLTTEPQTNGCVAEVHGEKVTYTILPAFVDEDTGANIENFWRLGYA